MSISIKNVTVAGGGILGSQIALQAAYNGFKVVIYDISEDAINKTKDSIEKWKKAYKRDLNSTENELKSATDNLRYSVDLGEAVKDADLVIEAVPENAKIKTEFYKKLADVAPEHTVFATNSSSMLPSQFAEATGRPEKFIALHFANEIWKRNVAEIMGHEGTSEEVYDSLVQFAEDINMTPVPVKKEQPGYVMNSLLIPFLSAATNLWANDIADPKVIDKTWMIATGAPKGPFGSIDLVGLHTPLNVMKMKLASEPTPALETIVNRLQKMVDEGKTGKGAGEGFYKYPNPEFEQDDFLGN